MRRPWMIALSGVVAIAIGIGIARLVVQSGVATGPPDAMSVVVTRAFPMPGQPTTTMFSQSFGTAQAQRIYATLLAEPDITGKVQSCPAISATLPYYHYVLTFTHRGAVVGTATSDAYGCEDIGYVANGVQTVYFWYNKGTSFWDVLHLVTNAPKPINAISGSLGA